jgi:hypothetical protein
MRGLRTVLVEQQDFGGGTSSRSSRLVHGGLRYLETGQLRLVLEANRERRVLLRIAPHLVWPLPFVFPLHRGDRVGPARLAPGGFLMMETYLTAQRELGWGPTSDDHLLRPGELAGLVAPLTIVHGREVLEAIDAERWRAVASVLAVKK